MDSKTLRSLRIGDTVRVHFTHPGASSDNARGRPFNVVIAAFNDTGRAYKEEDGRYYESRQISWRWTDLPLELQPPESVRDNVRGMDTCSESWIVELIDRAPYKLQASERNVLFAEEQRSFFDHLRVDNYRKAKGEDINPFGLRQATNPTGYRYSGYNETYGLNIGKEQYNGHLFKLAEALLARRPQIAVSARLDADRFYAAWNQAGRPGYAGPYRETHFSPFTRDQEGKRINPSPYKALINIKSFRNWVVRNAHRFTMTKAVMVRNMILAAADEEKALKESMDDYFEIGRNKLIPSETDESFDPTEGAMVFDD